MRRGKRHLSGLDDEIRDHIERETQDNIERGMAPDEARRQAILKFGNINLVKEDTRAVWTVVWLEQCLQDLRYAMRTLCRNPGFTAVVALTLTLAIGMTATVFSIFNAVLLRPLPYPDADRLLWVTTFEKEWNEEFVDDAEFRSWREEAASFEHLVAYETRDMTLGIGAEPVRAGVALVSEEFWKLSGVVPALGQLPQSGEPGVMVSNAFFHRFLKADPNLVGKPLALPELEGGRPVVVAGVLPQDAQFRFPRNFATRLAADEVGVYVSAPDPPFSALNGIIAKVKPNVSIDSARAELEVIRSRKSGDRPPQWIDKTELRVVPLQEKIVGRARRSLWMLLVAVGFVLMIACANVANLLVARATTRRRETAIRASVGAGRGRVLRQFIVESALLSGMGGIGGLLLARWSIDLIVRLFPEAVPRLPEAGVLGSILAFTGGASLATAFLFGFAPALTLWKLDLHDVLKDGGGAASASRSGLRLRRLLVVAQLAFAAALLCGAGLMVKSFWRMYTHPAGFEPDRILLLNAAVSGPRYFNNAERQNAYLSQVLDALKSSPAVTAASILYRGPAQDTWVDAPPLPEGQEPPVMVGTAVSADYAGVMALQVVKGRWLTDHEAEPVIVINESLARRDFPGQDPIGKRLRSVGAVVGIVRSLKFSRLDAEPEPEFFVPYAAYRDRSAGRGEANTTFAVRTAGDAVAAAPAIQQLVSKIDPTQPIYDVKSLEQRLGESIAPRQFNLLLLASFAATALLIALIGIYGVTAFVVTQRIPEIGTRIALGARRSDILRMIVRQAMTMALFGIALGVAGALALTRLMVSLLYDVAPWDPETFVAVSIVLVCSALLACWLPALKAALVDPIIALRYE